MVKSRLGPSDNGIASRSSPQNVPTSPADLSCRVRRRPQITARPWPGRSAVNKAPKQRQNASPAGSDLFTKSEHRIGFRFVSRSQQTHVHLRRSPNPLPLLPIGRRSHNRPLSGKCVHFRLRQRSERCRTGRDDGKRAQREEFPESAGPRRSPAHPVPLASGKKSVTEPEELLAARQSAVSRQLARPRLWGLVASRCNGKAICHRLADKKAHCMVETVYDLFCKTDEDRIWGTMQSNGINWPAACDSGIPAGRMIVNA